MKQCHVGITATSQGMSPGQVSFFKQEITSLWRMCQRQGEELHFHHGDCVGGDEQAHNVVRPISPDIIIEIHPPSNPKARAWCKGNIVYPEKPYLVRNHEMVDMLKILFVGPKRNMEELRSGTWATFRYARSKAVHIVMIER